MKAFLHCKGIIRLLVVFICFATPSAFADQLSFLVNGKAIHFNNNTGEKQNESNWGAGFQYDIDSRYSTWSKFVTVSGFVDSNSNPSYYFGGGYQKKFNLSYIYPKMHLKAGVVGFIMWREDYEGGQQLFPGLLPAVTIGTERVALNVTYIPKFREDVVPAIFLQLKVSMSN